MNRRELLKRGTLLGVGSASLPASALLNGCNASEKADQAIVPKNDSQGSLSNKSTPKSILTESEYEMVKILSELIIPETETPGAIEAGVPDFVSMMVSDWYSDDERKAFLEGLDLLNNHCSVSFAKKFLICTPQEQTIALENLAQNVAGTVSDRQLNGANSRLSATSKDWAPWGHFERTGAEFFEAIKDLVILGYYTSEVGVTSELLYLPIPGYFDGDVDFENVGRHYTS